MEGVKEVWGGGGVMKGGWRGSLSLRQAKAKVKPSTKAHTPRGAGVDRTGTSRVSAAMEQQAQTSRHYSVRQEDNGGDEGASAWPADEKKGKKLKTSDSEKERWRETLITRSQRQRRRDGR